MENHHLVMGKQCESSIVRLPVGARDHDPPKNLELVRVLMERPPNFPGGTVFFYSNAGGWA
jgi:hypothetical protein